MNLFRTQIAMGIGALALALAVPAVADDAAAVKKELMANFNKATKQFKAKDIKGFMSMYTDDFKGKGMGGMPQTKASITKEMKEAMDTTKSLDKSELKISKLTVQGNTAQVESAMTLGMKVVDAKGEMGPKGKTHDMLMVENGKEIWVKTKSGWKVKSGEVLPSSKMLVDGKPPPPPKKIKPKTKK